MDWFKLQEKNVGVQLYIFFNILNQISFLFVMARRRNVVSVGPDAAKFLKYNE